MAEYKSKVDIIYEKLLDDIKAGKYSQGDRLVISQIAKKNDVSEIPVREAIRRLESGGYAQIKANHGAVVYARDEKWLTHLFEVKAVLEGFAAGTSVSKMTPAKIQWLKHKNREMELTLQRGDYKKYSVLNKQFHLMIYKTCGNDVLYSMICDLWDKWSIGQMTRFVSEKRFFETIEEHRAIINMIEEGNVEEVENLMRQHKHKAAEEIINA